MNANDRVAMEIAFIMEIFICGKYSSKLRQYQKQCRFYAPGAYGNGFWGDDSRPGEFLQLCRCLSVRHLRMNDSRESNFEGMDML